MRASGSASRSGRRRGVSPNSLWRSLPRLGYSARRADGVRLSHDGQHAAQRVGFATDVIELQLAHAERNKVRATYNNAQRLAERRRMMQTWAGECAQSVSHGSTARATVS